jgi:hypothetical protein
VAVVGPFVVEMTVDILGFGDEVGGYGCIADGEWLLGLLK